ncbi:hypothetical protein AB833_19795 [Chromatiales bacterium (ex Bugula neritina AB1)]|nr:hypothetical protein AB833_19795 [Chromatiales bacterium (ex Bugula neritina AB1)]
MSFFESIPDKLCFLILAALLTTRLLFFGNDARARLIYYAITRTARRTKITQEKVILINQITVHLNLATDRRVSVSRLPWIAVIVSPECC